MSFTRRRIDLKFTLGAGSFGEGGNSVEITGLRCSANIVKAGQAAMSSLSLTVWGMTLDQMNKLTVLNTLQYTNGVPNMITVLAGDDTGVSVAFRGNIKEAWADLHAAPDASFHVAALNGGYDSIKPADATSYRGDVNITTILKDLGGRMDPPRKLEDNGVSVILRDQYLAGTLVEQARIAAEAAHVNMYLDDTDLLAIWPQNGERKLAPVTLSPETGLVGYPAFSQNNVILRTLYSKTAAIAGPINVKSSLAQANGHFVAAKITHSLDSEMPGGQWFTDLECGIPGQDAPIAGGSL